MVLSHPHHGPYRRRSRSRTVEPVTTRTLHPFDLRKRLSRARLARSIGTTKVMK